MRHTKITPGQKIDMYADPEESTPAKALNEAIEFCREHEFRCAVLEYGNYAFVVNPDSDISELILEYKGLNFTKGLSDDCTLICDLFDVDIECLFSEDRISNQACEARYLLAFKMKYDAGLTHTAIGEKLGARTASTITHAIKRVHELSSVDKGFRRKVEILNLDKYLYL